ncbi:MAG: competence/damage-inducible protein A [Clostridia bacterium]|nr:competence/damage-inducible protein A [Lachnospiraceae bacterium]NCB99069.1 competence/damage-inducible protein A [Clostridia bacterium]NCD03497.1 competence/damage-inducible protein A [Clostridia bacterium]
MVIELISVGTEILLGNITNTNARYLAEECAVLGLSDYYQVTVGDNEKRLSATIKTALKRADIILLTGGLGPTEDDLTRETVAKVLGREMKESPEIHQQIQDYFERMGARGTPDNNWKQAMVIEGAKIVENHNGTAPGMIVEVDETKRIILMPGPPEELKQMFEESIAPYLASLNNQVIVSKTVKICGMGESRVAEAIADLIQAQTNPTIGTYAKGGEVHLRITASGEDSKAARKSIKPVVKEIKSRFGDKIYTTRESESLEQHVIGLLKRKSMTVTTAESCTGGLVAGELINVAGASEVFREGYITYSNEAKHRILGVKNKTLKTEGAVSAKCAEEMAKGAAKAANARAAISVTGIAGPDGGTPEKPVGLVYIGCYIDGKVWVESYHMNGNRQKVRELTVKKALDMLRRCISDSDRS